MNRHEERVKLLQSESDRFRQYLTTLSNDAWTRQSACDRWQVRDVVTHLMGNAEGYAASVSRGLMGDSSPPEGRGPAGASNAASSAEGLAQRVISQRESLGDRLLPSLKEQDNHLIGLLTGLNSEDQDKPCYHPGGIVPAGNFVDLRFKELALHQWDIQSRLEPEAHLSPDSLPSMIILLSNALASGSVPWAFWPSPGLASTVRYRFEVAEPVPIKADIAVEGDKARLEDSTEGYADVTFRCDTETFVLLMYGRLAPEPAVADGRLAVEGDADLAAQFSQWFKGI
ncbi:MAG: hypothetical protein BZY88_03950 [SAR202 cluster bacterium Io17-Chloro-G9]|nr:MAG: hypothetical protein BZY88_03950 [SAR202 cluster bacterium Io17-Chloro-G9]